MSFISAKAMKREKRNLENLSDSSELLSSDVEVLLAKLPRSTPNKKVNKVKQKNVDDFEQLFGQLQGIYDELAVLSKKSPSDVVNMFKLKFINQLLNESNGFLGEKYRPFNDFSEFDPDDVPQNSDVVFMLSQYLQCFEKFRADSVVMRSGYWYWVVDAEKGDKGDENGLVYIRTTTPKRLRD
jgi:hypothetical protein